MRPVHPPIWEQHLGPYVYKYTIHHISNYWDIYTNPSGKKEGRSIIVGEQESKNRRNFFHEFVPEVNRTIQKEPYRKPKIREWVLIGSSRPDINLANEGSDVDVLAVIGEEFSQTLWKHIQYICALTAIRMKSPFTPDSYVFPEKAFRRWSINVERE